MFLCPPAPGIMVLLPTSLTEEEESLQRKFAKLKKKKKALLALKKQTSTNQTSQTGIKRSLSDQPIVDTATATEQAKMLVKTGAISAIKSGTKNSGFKRSRTLECKLKDPDKGPAPTFQPFQRSFSVDEDPAEGSRRAQRKSLNECFVSSSDRMRDPERDPDDRESDRDSRRGGDREPYDRERGRERYCDRDRDRDRDRSDRDRKYSSFSDRRKPRKGNTLYVNGVGMKKPVLNDAFAKFGKIIDLSMDPSRNCAFVTYEKMESADQAIQELNNMMMEDVTVKVSMARKQPMLDAASEKSVWGQLGSFPDHREPRKGNTLYVHGVGLKKPMLNEAFSKFGKIIDLATETSRNCAFITFEKMESADQAIQELNNTMIDDILVKVSMAWKQPMLDAAVEKSLWGPLGAFSDRSEPRKGNTLYVHGIGMKKPALNDAFAKFGNIIDLSTDPSRNCAFVTYEKLESADQAIQELNNTVIEDVTVEVSMARKQPMLKAALEKSLWGQLALENNMTGPQLEKGPPIVYSEDFFNMDPPAAEDSPV
ncbi:negative elongation factor E isoform X2 [Pseudophryne corroboree]|uniref:negative elongation factor E isoform X2 n=1 Tax=Pseudophryne corroboree TaxID=495146 RepID=UPI0030813922